MGWTPSKAADDTFHYNPFDEDDEQGGTIDPLQEQLVLLRR